MRFGAILNISGAKPCISSVPPVSRTSASPLISMPRTRQGFTDAMSSTTKATLGFLRTSRYFFRLAKSWPPMSMVSWSGL
jgi:hypothetical protein